VIGLRAAGRYRQPTPCGTSRIRRTSAVVIARGTKTSQPRRSS